MFPSDIYFALKQLSPYWTEGIFSVEDKGIDGRMLQNELIISQEMKGVRMLGNVMFSFAFWSDA